jgi:hypothetical protein
MANRLVFTLSTVLAVLFFALSNFDRYFFLLHFLEASIYIVILLLLYYGLEEWAYPLAFLSAILWLLLAILAGVFWAGVRGLGELVGLYRPMSGVDVMAGLIILAALGLVAASGYAFRREIWGRPGVLVPTLCSAAIVGLYNGLLIYALLRLARGAG